MGWKCQSDESKKRAVRGAQCEKRGHSTKLFDHKNHQWQNNKLHDSVDMIMQMPNTTLWAILWPSPIDFFHTKNSVFVKKSKWPQSLPLHYTPYSTLIANWESYHLGSSRVLTTTSIPPKIVKTCIAFFCSSLVCSSLLTHFAQICPNETYTDHNYHNTS